MARRACRLLLLLAAVALAGCTTTSQALWRYVILPEQRRLEFRDPAVIGPPIALPPVPPPRTVTRPQPLTPEWRVSLDEAIRIALENAGVIRVLAGVSAVSSGRTIYD